MVRRFDRDQPLAMLECEHPRVSQRIRLLRHQIGGAWCPNGAQIRTRNKKALKIRASMVAPTGIEPATSGPGRSRALTKTLILSGFRRFTVPADSDQYRGDSAAP